MPILWHFIGLLLHWQNITPEQFCCVELSLFEYHIPKSPVRRSWAYEYFALESPASAADLKRGPDNRAASWPTTK